VKVLSIEELVFDGDLVRVDAIVDDMALVYPQTYSDPAEWGPALCRGTFYLSDEDLIPATDDELCRLVGDRVDDWMPIDTSDWYD